MGCDIHLVLERRDDEFGWVGIDTFRGHRNRKGDSSWPSITDRYYLRFAALAGVRGEGPEPKGIPEDASPLTRLIVREWGPDGHSHSWLSIQDAIPIFTTRFHSSETPLDPESYEAKYPSDFYFGVDDPDILNTRLIFWFDN